MYRVVGRIFCRDNMKLFILFMICLFCKKNMCEIKQEILDEELEKIPISIVRKF